MVFMLNRKHLTGNLELWLMWRGSKVGRPLPQRLEPLLVIYWLQLQEMNLAIIRILRS